MSELSNRLVTGLTAAALTLCLGAAPADKDAKELEPIRDADFVAQVMTLARIDVRYSELAAKQTESDKIKEFAQKMLKEHNRREVKIADAGRDLKAGLDYELANEAKAVLERLSNLQGAEFDREYVKLMVADYEKVVALFEREVKSGTAPGDQDVRDRRPAATQGAAEGRPRCLGRCQGEEELASALCPQRKAGRAARRQPAGAKQPHRRADAAPLALALRLQETRRSCLGSGGSAAADQGGQADVADRQQRAAEQVAQLVFDVLGRAEIGATVHDQHLIRFRYVRGW